MHGVDIRADHACAVCIGHRRSPMNRRSRNAAKMARRWWIRRYGVETLPENKLIARTALGWLQYWQGAGER
jgi:hypothetical protein